MDRPMKLFFFFCFVVFFFTGCGKNGNRNEAVKGPDAKEAAKAAAQMKIETQNKELQEIRKLLSSSDNLFTQTWQIINQKNENPNNVFRIVNALIAEHQKLEKEKATTAANKDQKATTVATNEVRVYTPFLHVKQIPAPTPVAKPNPASTPTTAPTTTTSVKLKEKTPDNKQPEKMINEYTIGFKETEAAGDNAKEKQVAKFFKLPAGYWQIEFTPENLGNGEFNGLGRQSVQLTGLPGDKKIVVDCRAMPSKQGVLYILDCNNLAQDLDEHKDLRLTKFTLNRRFTNDKCEQAFKVTGIIYNNSAEKEEDQELPLSMKNFCKADGKPAIDLTMLERAEEEAAKEPTKTEPQQGAPPIIDVPTAGTDSDPAAADTDGNEAAKNKGEGQDPNAAKPGVDKNTDGKPNAGGSDSQNQGEGDEPAPEEEDTGKVPPEAVT